jgi:hypothetical protein
MELPSPHAQRRSLGGTPLLQLRAMQRRKQLHPFASYLARVAVGVAAVGPAEEEEVVVAPAVEAFVVVQRAHIAADNASRDRAGPITARAFANRSAEPVARNR